MGSLGTDQLLIRALLRRQNLWFNVHFRLHTICFIHLQGRCFRCLGRNKVT